MTVVTVVCAWCQKILGTKESEMGGLLPQDAPPITHGICDGCSDELMSQANGSKEQDLDYRD